MKFYGNIISRDGVKPDPGKVNIIIRMPPPINKTELSSFLGMCNYLGPSIPQLSDITDVLRQLIKKSVTFTWNETYDRALRQAKLHVANTVTLKYFDPSKANTVECDASGTGIGGTLLQDGQPILFVSQALTDTQKHYSNIECELLAVVVTVECLHHYLFGHQFEVHTDHSPLVCLIQKCLNDMSPLLQCLLLRLSQYQMEIKYVTHKCVPMADCLDLLTSKQGKMTLVSTCK